MKHLNTSILLLSLFALISCKEQDLSGNYKIISIGDTNVEKHEVTMTIEMSAQENRISGKAACNRYFGSFTVNNDGSINLNPVGSTKMYCMDAETNTVESQFHEHLEKVHTVQPDSNGITLLDKDGNTLMMAKKQDANN